MQRTNQMAPDLAAFLARLTPAGEGTAVWADGAIRLKIAAYLTEELPPLDYVTSVRGVVFRGASVLVLRNRWGRHVVPGGRREPGESVHETLVREVLEESGWRIAAGARLFAVQHFRHLTPKPPDYRYAYPDFLWLVYVAQATDFVPNAMLEDDSEGVVEATFYPIAQAQALGLSAENLFFLNAALQARTK